MRIAMTGNGYVGLVSGACFSDFEHEVVCTDKDVGKIASLRRGTMSIYKPGLEALVATDVGAGRPSFTTDLGEAVHGADTVFITVGTPSRRGDGHADLSYVPAAAEEIARATSGDTLLVTESMVPVGTGNEIERIVLAAVPGRTPRIVSNPKFLREGAAIEDSKRQDRVICRTDDKEPRAVRRRNYRPLSLNEAAPLLFTSRRTAELIKYAANAFLTTKINFINEVADLCAAVDADVQDVARGIGLDNRIGRKFLHAGPGYSSSCFPKDTLALLQTAEQHETPLRIVEATVAANETRKRGMRCKIIHTMAATCAVARSRCSATPSSPTPTICATRPRCRSSGRCRTRASLSAPAIQRASNRRAGCSARTSCSRPTRSPRPRVPMPWIVTKWEAYRSLDLARLAATLRTPLLVDLRNVYTPAEAKAADPCLCRRRQAGMSYPRQPDGAGWQERPCAS